MSADISDLLPEGLDLPAEPTSESLKVVSSRPGVWLLLAADGQPVTAGATQNLRRALVARLADADRARRRGALHEVSRSVRFAATCGRFESDWLYARLAERLWRRDFWQKVAFGPAWFVRVDNSHAALRLQPTTALLRGQAGLGPVACRSDAYELIELLTDLFDLCRDWKTLEQAPGGRPCPYYEMGRCKAPCCGNVPIEEYNAMLLDAVRKVGEGLEVLLAGRRRQMSRAASSLQFERAAQIRSWLQRASRLRQQKFSAVRFGGELCGIIVSCWRDEVKPFFFWSGVVEPAEPVNFRSVGSALDEWREALWAGPKVTADDFTLQWQYGLVCSVVLGPARAGVVWLDRRASRDEWMQTLRSSLQTSGRGRARTGSRAEGRSTGQ